MINIRTINNYLFILLGFSFPISIAVANIAITLITILWLLEMDFKRKFEEIRKNKLAIAIMIFLGVYILGLLWSPNTSIGKHIITFHYVLFLFPVFLTTIDAKYVNKAIFSFVIAMSISEIASYAMYFDLWDGFVPGEEYSTAFISHLFYTPLLAITVFILLNQLIYSNDSQIRKLIYAVFITTMSFNIFISGGRAGQMAFIVLSFIFAFLYFKKNKMLLISLFVTIPLIVGLIYVTNDAFRERTNMSIETLKSGSLTGGLGLRIAYTLNTFEIISDNFIFGVGTGGFKTAYNIADGKTHFTINSVDQPHNEYLFSMAQHGVFGLLSLLFILLSMLKFSRNHEIDLMQKIRYIFLFFFSIIMLSDIYLYGFVTQTLFVYFGVILYKKFEQNPFILEGKLS